MEMSLERPSVPNTLILPSPVMTGTVALLRRVALGNCAPLVSHLCCTVGGPASWTCPPFWLQGANFLISLFITFHPSFPSLRISARQKRRHISSSLGFVVATSFKSETVRVPLRQIVSVSFQFSVLSENSPGIRTCMWNRDRSAQALISDLLSVLGIPSRFPKLLQQQQGLLGCAKMRHFTLLAWQRCSPTCLWNPASDPEPSIKSSF